MADVPYVLPYVVFAAIFSVLVLTPLPWHLHSWNGGTCLIMVYAAIGSLICAVDKSIWADNVEYELPIWCDITTRILIGLSVGLPAAAFCLTRRLYIIASSRGGIPSEQRLKALIFDLSIGFGFPLLVLGPFYYIVQGHRYNIIIGFGCRPAAVNTLATYFLILMWPVLFGVATLSYGVLATRAFFLHRKKMEAALATGTSLTEARFIRLISLTIVSSISTLPPSIFVIWQDARSNGLRPWISWTSIKWGYSAVWRFSTIPRETRHTQEFLDWLFIVVAIQFLLFFAQESTNNYLRVFRHLIKKFSSNLAPESQKTSFTSSEVTLTDCGNVGIQTNVIRAEAHLAAGDSA
ncbi:fungal pheromone STE3G-protein-coupled receptor [Sistotremastrum niveocremeum HHB9708]|uniref:Fungal pheromone STE3G-protein-coupled receptor n=1 Tax=Sistotremastrum niveocremeum HHB9708 TaxID=1314777 RepID=A0A164V4I1_9AGAM|nr:fungal pheromone STE3G-protein-coupled receptor [Sistotremastrum niveocremeum HHB9708]